MVRIWEYDQLSILLIGFSLINPPFWDLPIFGNPQPDLFFSSAVTVPAKHHPAAVVPRWLAAWRAAGPGFPGETAMETPEKSWENAMEFPRICWKMMCFLGIACFGRSNILGVLIVYLLIMANH